MSDYGLRVLNDNSKLQIDSLYTNYVLWEHGESSTTTKKNGYYDSVITFAANNSQPPLIAIKPDTDDYCGLQYYYRSGSDYSGFNVLSEYLAVTFSWQAFIPTTSESSATYGLRVYNPSAVLVFDSGRASMVISDVDTANPAYTAVQTITHPSDSNAYYIVSPWGRIQTVGEWNGSTSKIRNYFPMLKSLSATTVSFGGREGTSVGSIPVEINQQRGFWPTLWTIITVKRMFF